MEECGGVNVAEKKKDWNHVVCCFFVMFLDEIDLSTIRKSSAAFVFFLSKQRRWRTRIM